jgi:hypothetical protein
MITADGFHDFATRDLLPASRIYPWRNSMRRIFHHSLEGVWGSYKAYLDPSRGMTGWTGTVLRSGQAIQHAPVWAGLAHGGPFANPYGPGWEAEGFAGEPLTAAQVRTYLRIHADMAAFTGFSYYRDGTNADFRLVEHGEAAPTACPSGRYFPLWAAVAAGGTQEDDLSAEDRARLDNIEKLLAGNGIAKDPAAYVASGFDPALLTFGAEALAYAVEKQWGVFLGIGIARDEAARALQAAAAGGSGAPLTKTPKHTHKPGEVIDP